MTKFEEIKLPKTLRRHQLIKYDENKYIEFKKRDNSQNIELYMAHEVPKYVSGFLNSGGGYLLFGVTNEGEVLGLQLDREMRDKVRCIFDKMIKYITPQVDAALHSLFFIPVYNEEVIAQDENDQQISDDQNSKELFVIAIKILKGKQIYYVQGKEGRTAYMRREGSTIKMDEQLIQRRNMDVQANTSNQQFENQQTELINQVIVNLFERWDDGNWFITIKDLDNEHLQQMIQQIHQWLKMQQKYIFSPMQDYSIFIEQNNQLTQVLKKFIQEYFPQYFDQQLPQLSIDELVITHYKILTSQLENAIFVIHNIDYLEFNHDIIPNVKGKCVIIATHKEENLMIKQSFNTEKFIFQQYPLNNEQINLVDQIQGISDWQLDQLLNYYESNEQKVTFVCEQLQNAGISIIEHLNNITFEIYTDNTFMQIYDAFKSLDNQIIKAFVKLSLAENITMQYMRYVFKNDIYMLFTLQRIGLIKKIQHTFVISDIVKRQLISVDNTVLTEALRTYIEYVLSLIESRDQLQVHQPDIQKGLNLLILCQKRYNEIEKQYQQVNSNQQENIEDESQNFNSLLRIAQQLGQIMSNKTAQYTQQFINREENPYVWTKNYIKYLLSLISQKKLENYKIKTQIEELKRLQ